MFDVIASLIREGFPEFPIVPESVAVEDTHSVEHLYELLVGRSYTQPSVDDYRACVDGMSLLTVEGLAYYLPGYMLACMKDLEEADVIPGAIVSTFAIGRWPTQDGRIAEIVRQFSSRQVQAFALWLTFYTIHFGHESDTQLCFKGLFFNRSPTTNSGFPDFQPMRCKECGKDVEYWGI